MVEESSDEQLPDWQFEDLVVDGVSQEMLDYLGRRTTVFGVGFGGHIETESIAHDHFEIIDLADDDDWTAFYNRARLGVKHNAAPWNRCVTILRERHAVVCVVERHYVCLDLRSEIAAFNSQLDTVTDSAANRLHFFSKKVSADQLFSLKKKQKKSYLGYIVLREPGSPSLGRTIIKAPRYIDLCASVDEPVNFFGQRLTVRGVPFMQQDERYAVCAHVAIWSILYSAYRRGVIDRKFIADVVVAANRSHTMHPSAPIGLTDAQAQRVMQHLGLHMPIYDLRAHRRLPFADIDVRDLGFSPVAVKKFDEHYQLLRAKIEPTSSADEFLATEASGVNLSDNPAVFIADLWRLITLAAREKPPTDAESDGGSQGANENPHKGFEDFYFECRALFDSVVRTQVEPYLHSGFPIYCQTEDHAMVLCGIAYDANGAVYYYHDDQFGPYMAARSIVGASRQGFRRQSYVNASDLNVIPGDDLADPARVGRGGIDKDRSVIAIGLPSPPRLLLSPMSARRAAASIVELAVEDWNDLIMEAEREDGKGNGPLPPLSSERKYVLSALMGIDYKAQRRDKSTSNAALNVFSCMHVAEWVVVIESVTDAGVEWEFVFDGTSSNRHPIIQFTRVATRAIYRNPQIAPSIEVFDIQQATFPPLYIPRRASKSGYISPNT